jgi:ABC-2 type transport system ATP-binding protein
MEHPDTMTSPAVGIHGLHHHYGAITAVDGIDADIAPGTTVAMLGPNGAGKSTTMHLLLGLLSTQTGKVRIFGEDPKSAVANGWVGAMLQETKLVPHLQVGELLRFVRGLYPDPMPQEELLDLAGLAEVSKRRLERLSGGQAQRVKFAVAMAGQPRLLVLDEPTAAMDVASRQAFWQAIRAYAEGGRTVLFSTHFLQEADRNADRIVVISRGRVVADGPPAALRGIVHRRTVSVARQRDLDWYALPGVTGVTVIADRVTLATSDADATVTALAHADAVIDLALSGPDLEDAFLAITSDDFTDNRAGSEPDGALEGFDGRDGEHTGTGIARSVR